MQVDGCKMQVVMQVDGLRPSCMCDARAQTQYLLEQAVCQTSARALTAVCPHVKQELSLLSVLLLHVRGLTGVCALACDAPRQTACTSDSNMHQHQVRCQGRSGWKLFAGAWRQREGFAGAVACISWCMHLGSVCACKACACS